MDSLFSSLLRKLTSRILKMRNMAVFAAALTGCFQTKPPSDANARSTYITSKTGEKVIQLEVNGTLFRKADTLSLNLVVLSQELSRRGIRGKLHVAIKTEDGKVESASKNLVIE